MTQGCSIANFKQSSFPIIGIDDRRDHEKTVVRNQQTADPTVDLFFILKLV